MIVKRIERIDTVQYLTFSSYKENKETQTVSCKPVHRPVFLNILLKHLCTKCAPNFTLIKCIADALPEKPITHYLSQLSIRVVYCKILSLILL